MQKVRGILPQLQIHREPSYPGKKFKLKIIFIYIKIIYMKFPQDQKKKFIRICGLQFCDMYIKNICIFIPTLNQLYYL